MKLSHIWLAVALLAALPTRLTHAQPMPDMTRSMDLAAFGAYTRSTPDYGGAHNNGVSAGIDFTRYFRFRVYPSLELRGWDAHGPTVNEKAVLVGIRVGSDFRRRYHPYADVLPGIFSIHYAQDPSPGYTSDRGVDVAYGAGIDIDVLRNIAVKADFLYQHVSIGGRINSFTLTPANYSLGVIYHIPFRPKTRAGDYQ